MSHSIFFNSKVFFVITTKYVIKQSRLTECFLIHSVLPVVLICTDSCMKLFMWEGERGFAVFDQWEQSRGQDSPGSHGAE